MTDEAVPLASKDSDRRTAFIRSLRDLAEFLEQHPAVMTPRYVTMNVFIETREEVTAYARLASWTKDYNGQFFSLQKSFGIGVNLIDTCDECGESVFDAPLMTCHECGGQEYCDVCWPQHERWHEGA